MVGVAAVSISTTFLSGLACPVFLAGRRYHCSRRRRVPHRRCSEASLVPGGKPARMRAGALKEGVKRRAPGNGGAFSLRTPSFLFYPSRSRGGIGFVHTPGRGLQGANPRLRCKNPGPYWSALGGYGRWAPGVGSHLTSWPLLTSGWKPTGQSLGWSAKAGRAMTASMAAISSIATNNVDIRRIPFSFIGRRVRSTPRAW